MTNGRSRKGEVKETVRVILPGVLVSFVSSILANLTTQLESSCDGHSVENSALKRALVTLREGQQSLEIRIHHEMSTEKQLALAYLISHLNMSLIECGGSLEQLQSSPQVAAFVALLLGLCHSPQEGDSEQFFSPDVLSLVVSAFSSIVHEHGLTLVDNPTVAEALDKIDVDFLEGFPLGHFLRGSTIRTLLAHDRGPKVKVDVGVNQSSSSHSQENQQNEWEEKKTEEWKEDMLFFHSIHQFLMQRKGFSLKQSNKVLGEGREGYKTITSIDDMVVERTVIVDTSLLQQTPVRYQPDVHVFNQSDSFFWILDENIFSEKSEPVDRVKKLDMKLFRGQGHQRFRSAYLSEAKNFSQWTETSSRHETLRELLTSLQKVQADTTGAVNLSCAQSPPPIPPQPPPTTWCWKVQIQSLGIEGLEDFINSGDLNALEEPDTECHETICHAIVCVFDTEQAVALVHALSERSLKVFERTDRLGNTPLHIAVETGNVIVAKEILTLCPRSLIVRNGNDDTPLDIANNNSLALIHVDVDVVSTSTPADRAQRQPVNNAPSLIHEDAARQPNIVSTGYESYAENQEPTSEGIAANEVNTVYSAHSTTPPCIQQSTYYESPPEIAFQIPSPESPLHDHTCFVPDTDDHSLKENTRPSSCSSIEGHAESTTLWSSNSSLNSAISHSSSSESLLALMNEVFTKPVSSVPTLEYTSTEESDEPNCKKRRPSLPSLIDYMWTDSVTSPTTSTPVKKRPKSAVQNKHQRKQTEDRILRYRLPTSESDTSICVKVHSRPKKRRNSNVQDNDNESSGIDCSYASECENPSSKISSDSEPCERTELSCTTSENTSYVESRHCSVAIQSPCARVVPLPDPCGTFSLQRFNTQINAHRRKPMGTKAMLAENIWISVTPAFDEMFIFLLCPYFPTYSCSALHDTRILSALVPITEISCCSVQCPQNGKETSFSKYQSQVSLTRTVADHRQAVLKYCECTCVGDVSSVPIASENYTDVMVLGFPTYLTTYYCSSLYTTTLLGPFIFPCPLVQFTHGKKGFKSKKNWSFSHVPVHVELKSVLHEIKSQLNITTTDYRGAPFRKGLSFKVSMNKQHKSSQSHIIKTKGIVQSPSSASTSRGVTFCYHTKSKFSRRNFKSWLLTTVQRTGYNRLRDIIHKDWHIIFGLVPVRGVTLTANQKKVAKAVFKVAKSMKSLPKYVLNNLCDLDEVVYGVHRDKVAKQGNQDQHNSTRGKKKQSKKEKFASNSTKDGAVKPLAGVQGIDSDYNTVTTAALTSEEEGKYGSSAHASSHGRGNERRHTSRKQTKYDSVQVALEGNPGVEKPTRSEDVLSAGVEHTEPLTLSRQSSKIEGYHRQRSKHDIPVEEESTYTSVLGFANTSSSLDVIQSHMTTYSKCCPRHDIQNTIVSGTTVPASDAFGPKRRYSSIKDIKDDPRHGNFDSSKSLTRIRRMNGSNYVYQERHHVMSDGPMPETVRRNRAANLHLDTDPTLSHQITSPLQPLHPVVPLSRQQDPSVNLPLHSQRQQTAHSESSSKLRREDTTETEPEKLEPTRRYGVTPTASSVRCSTQSSRADNSLQSHLAPDDHKERLKSTAELLHAQDYARILPLAYDGQPPTYFPSEVRIPYIFIAGLAYYKMSNHKKSVQYFQQCRRLAEECGRDGDVTICNIYMGDIDFAQRNYTEAAGRYQTALHYYSRDSVAKDFRMILPTKSAVWAKCGSAFKNASRVGDAVAAYERAIEVSSSKKDKLSAHTSLGNLFQGIGENERAVKEYESAIDLATELGDDVSLGWNHGNLGNALLGLHLRDKALHHLFKALDMAVDYETTPQAIGRAYNNLGTAYQSLNELDKAEEYYDFALAQAIYGNDISGQARVYGNIGNLQMLNKQYDRAVPHYTEVMRLSQDKATITTAHHNRGCAYYDWAEKKKKNAVTLRSAPKSSSMFKISLHGPEFERCKEKYRPLRVPESVQKYYLQGTRDLEYVIKHHEENLHGIQGSPKGLSLSVSLFETNSRTFHRMQDCLIHLQKAECRRSRFEDALLVAEQSRARTLGELLLKRRGPQLQHQLQSPPTLDQLNIIVSRQSSPVVYLSYTGERVLGWLLYPTSSSECSLNMFEVPLSDNEFDGKSFDYHLQYSLNEQLVERSFEMYKPFDDSDKSKTEPVEKLYDLVGKPVMAMLKELDKQHQEKDDTKESRKDKVRKIVIVPDSYTNLLPFTCVLNRKTGKFWGDSFYFQIMPSLLTMGILDQLPAVSVAIPVQHQQMLCVVGNPTIPPFKYNNDQWDLGKLPHATKEAEWVSHILKCNPILHEQATKDAVMMRIMNAKVIHLATHGSAVAGFLAFAGMSASSTEVVDAKKVLIYPEEIESLNISPALVVLSSCDSGRGVFKADGIQGMARAFILAGAQAVLTTLWRVPDESACIFMQFFYQYLVDGMKGTEALHKAILCLRCFSKYSQYIHWSGYQLTGREFQFDVSVSSARAELTTRLGQSSVFPRLDILKGLETAFMNNPRLPTDVQVQYNTVSYVLYV